MNKIQILLPILSDTNEVVVHRIKENDILRWTVLTTLRNDGEHELETLIRALRDKSGLDVKSIKLGQQRMNLPVYQSSFLTADLLLFKVDNYDIINEEKLNKLSLLDYRRIIDEEEVDYMFYSAYYLFQNKLLR